MRRHGVEALLAQPRGPFVHRPTLRCSSRAPSPRTTPPNGPFVPPTARRSRPSPRAWPNRPSLPVPVRWYGSRLTRLTPGVAAARRATARRFSSSSVSPGTTGTRSQIGTPTAAAAARLARIGASGDPDDRRVALLVEQLEVPEEQVGRAPPPQRRRPAGRTRRCRRRWRDPRPGRRRGRRGGTPAAPAARRRRTSRRRRRCRTPGGRARPRRGRAPPSRNCRRPRGSRLGTPRRTPDRRCSRRCRDERRLAGVRRHGGRPRRTSSSPGSARR